jgi:hypothetical protein
MKGKGAVLEAIAHQLIQIVTNNAKSPSVCHQQPANACHITLKISSRICHKAILSSIKRVISSDKKILTGLQSP